MRTLGFHLLSIIKIRSRKCLSEQSGARLQHLPNDGNHTPSGSGIIPTSTSHAFIGLLSYRPLTGDPSRRRSGPGDTGYTGGGQVMMINCA